MISKTNPKRNKHMSFDDRQEIHECLNKGMSFKAIASRIGKDPTTISKEVKKHLKVNEGGIGRIDEKGKVLSIEVCPKHLRAPFVCNPCMKKHYSCKYQKRYYHAKPAQKEYEELLSESREGIPLNRESFYEIDRIISAGLKKGQHLYHIMETNDIGISKSTAYRHLHRGYLSASHFDFPRVVKFKARKPQREEYVPKAAKIGRTYDDFLLYSDQNAIKAWVEMDTVIGRVGGKTILTMDFTFCNFMIGLLLEDRTSLEVTLKVESLKTRLAEIGTEFGDIIPLLVTDNGGEFANISAIENNSDGERETFLYFCDPYRSCQKPKVEKNHTLFRDVAPKGTSFDSFSQQDVNLIFSHVNSVKRKIFGGKSPYEMFVFAYGDAVTKAMGIEFIPPDKVIQSPKLLKSLE